MRQGNLASVRTQGEGLGRCVGFRAQDLGSRVLELNLGAWGQFTA